MNNIMARNTILIGLIFGAAVTGCQPAGSFQNQTSPPPTIAVQVTKETQLPAIDPTAIPACTPLPDGAQVSATAINSTTASVDLAGFVLGEELVIDFFTTLGNTTYGVGASNLEYEVDESGRFSYIAEHLRPLPNATSNHWNIRITHSQGVACAEVTLPAE